MILTKLNKFIRFGIVYFMFFLIGDIIVSNFFINKKIENNCYEWLDDFYRLKKNCYAKEKWIKKSKSYKVFTDENGFRYSGNKKINNNKTKTAIFFGGSFTYGMGTSHKKSFVGLIENEKSDYNILNLGVAGYSPTVFNYQLNELLKNEIIPDKIFLILDIIDVNTEATNWELRNGNGRPININQIPDTNKNEKKFKNFKRKNFKVTRMITSSINNSLRSLRFHVSKLRQDDKDIEEKKKKKSVSRYISFLSEDKKELDESFWGPYGFDQGIIKIENSIKKISNTAKKIDADLYIIIYPWPGTLKYGQNQFNWEEFAEGICRKNKCKKLINFFPDFNEIKESSNNWVNKLFIEDDVHLTNYGHNLVAKKIILESF